MNDLIFGSAKGIAEAIRNKKVSSLEVVDLCLARISEVNQDINAVVKLAVNRAEREAREADHLLSNGTIKGPLHGVPITLKDSIDTEGIVTTGGTMGRKDFIPKKDATVAERLRSAGAIVMGKTNTPELTILFETDNDVYGRTNNPYNVSKTPGGSSGGAAAIVASGGSPLDMGSDTGGSIRVPAHFCGIAGLKPTYGRVPRTGHIIPHGMGAVDGYTTIGPMSRFVEDLTYTLPIIAGPDDSDPFIVDVPLRSPEDVKISDLKVAFHTDNGILAPSSDISDAVIRAERSFSDSGAFVEEKIPPPLERMVGMIPMPYDGWAWLYRLLEKYGTSEPNHYIKGRIQTMGQAKTVSEYTDHLEKIDEFRSDMLNFIEDYDLILCPVRPYVATDHGACELPESGLGMTYTNAYNVTGWPATVVRVSDSQDGLPIGVQMLANPWREDIALAAARHLEKSFGGWSMPQLVTN